MNFSCWRKFLKVHIKYTILKRNRKKKKIYEFTLIENFYKALPRLYICYEDCLLMKYMFAKNSRKKKISLLNAKKKKGFTGKRDKVTFVFQNYIYRFVKLYFLYQCIIRYFESKDQTHIRSYTFVMKYDRFNIISLSKFSCI